MIVLHTDLDNTLIYSYKNKPNEDMINVEIYQDREISFITRKTYELLLRLKERVLIIPTTTRTIEQYLRINLGIGSFKYELVCNGGVLLENGVRNEKWYIQSRDIIKDSIIELNRAISYLENVERRYFEIRFIEELFVFTKCREPLEVVLSLKNILDLNRVYVFNNGEKVYVLPRGLEKGRAVERLRNIIKPKEIWASGDSEFDISMLEKADFKIAPYGFKKEFGISFNIDEPSLNDIFSEYLLNKFLSKAGYK